MNTNKEPMELFCSFCKRTTKHGDFTMEELDRWKCYECGTYRPKQQAPSATVDEEIKKDTSVSADVKHESAKLTDALMRHESLYGKLSRDFVFSMMVTAFTELHSQQPTVESETIRVGHYLMHEYNKQSTVEVDALWEKFQDIGIQQGLPSQLLGMSKRNFTKALTEALRGGYTREDMIAILKSKMGWTTSQCAVVLSQYDIERGK